MNAPPSISLGRVELSLLAGGLDLGAVNGICQSQISYFSLGRPDWSPTARLDEHRLSENTMDLVCAFGEQRRPTGWPPQLTDPNSNFFSHFLSIFSLMP
jgi:hypothetical protein